MAWVAIAKVNGQRFDRGQVVCVLRHVSSGPGSKVLRPATSRDTQEQVLGKKSVRSCQAVWVDDESLLSAIEGSLTKSKVLTPEMELKTAAHDGSGKGR